MEHENLESDPSPSPAEKPGRSKLERAIVWTVIGGLIVVTGMEALASWTYAKTVSNLETAIDETETALTLADFNKNIKTGLAIQSTGDRDGEPTISYSWPSLLKEYKLHLTVANDGSQNLDHLCLQRRPPRHD